MACFGPTELVLVAPYKEPNAEAYNWSCHGKEILEHSRTVDTLEEALLGANMTVGFTRRAGRHRHKMESLQDFSQEINQATDPGTVALLFGNEESGLSNDELDGCHRLVTIPSLGSLNLAHSVSLALYDILCRTRPVPGHRPKELASPELRTNMMRAVRGHLEVMGYPYHRASLEEETAKFADILERAELETWETNFICGMFKHLRIKFEQLHNKTEEK